HFSTLSLHDALPIWMGVEVRTGARVSAVRADGIELAGGEFIPAELTVWAAGVKGPEVLAHLDGLEVNRANQLVTDATLATTRDRSEEHTSELQSLTN